MNLSPILLPLAYIGALVVVFALGVLGALAICARDDSDEDAKR